MHLLASCDLFFIKAVILDKDLLPCNHHVDAHERSGRIDKHFSGKDPPPTENLLQKQYVGIILMGFCTLQILGNEIYSNKNA